MTSMVRLCSAALVMSGILACSDMGSEPSIEHLEVRYLGGSIVADMMPVISPEPNDRIFCTVDLIVRNSSAQWLDVRLRIMRADLRRSGTRTRLGTLSFATDWDGILEPFQTDTLRLVKRALSEDFAQPECEASVELDCEIGESEDVLIRFTAAPMIFHCVY